MATVTAIQINNFINLIAPLAREQYNKGKLILPSVCIAQAACESGWGTTQRMTNAKAVFGIKVGKNRVHFGTAWKDKEYSTKTKECYDGTNYVSIVDNFRAYDTIQESVEDYYDMLCSCSRYRAAVGAADPVATITAIKNGGYATSPTYIQTICKIIVSHNLTQYDSVNYTLAENYYPAPTIATHSIVDALTSVGVDATYKHRAKIAAANGIVGYTGTAEQNNTLVILLYTGKLRKE